MNQHNGTICDGHMLLHGLQAAAHWLNQHVGDVNALNVFPVPDGDTGTNMHLTLSAAVNDVQAQSSAAAVAEQVYRKALMGARGNSGVILSQIIRGFAEGIGGKPELDGQGLALALRQAAERAYKAVMKPTEGTILTVARVAGEKAMAVAETGADFEQVLEAAVLAADEAVAETPNQLKQLRDAGVVDAGGKGLAIVLQGMLKHTRGEEIKRSEADVGAVAVAFDIDEIHSEDDFGYCTTFLIEGENIPFEEVRATIASMGQSVVVVGDESLVKAHIHIERPGDVLNYAIGFGALTGIEIANMDKQKAAIKDTGMVSADATRAPKESAAAIGVKAVLPTEPVAPIGIVAVAPGQGFVDLFHSLNAGKVITGGQTMNPSTQDLVGAINELPQQEVIILPNNSNILMASRQAQELVDKTVRVIPSKTVPQGMAALLAFNYTEELEANVESMSNALKSVRTLEITTAVRDATVDEKEVRMGQTIGLLDGTLVEAGDDRDQVIDAMLDRVDMEDYEVLTIYYGATTTEEQAQALAERITERYSHLDTVEVQCGGQPFYDFIISAE
ncbi:MAG TPA: DAK2 domain-containing protein [Herpetosiphonaceae bacterium]